MGHPQKGVDRKAERKQLVEQAKALRRDGAGATEDATDAPAPPDDAPMTDGAKPAFAYAVDAKKRERPRNGARRSAPAKRDTMGTSRRPRK